MRERIERIDAQVPCVVRRCGARRRRRRCRDRLRIDQRHAGASLRKAERGRLADGAVTDDADVALKIHAEPGMLNAWQRADRDVALKTTKRIIAAEENIHRPRLA